MKQRIIPIILIVLIATGGGLWWYASSNPQFSAKLGFQPSLSRPGVFASGFIEATDVSIAPEVGGRIIYIALAEGDEAKAGVPLVRLDDSLLQAQQRQAEAAVKLAEAGLEQTTMSRNQAIVNRDGAKKSWEDALDVQKNPLELDARITAAQNELAAAEVALKFEREEASKYPGRALSLFWNYSFAKQRRDNAETMLQSLLNIKNNPQEINAAVDRARTAFDTAVAAVGVAEKAVTVAQRQVEQAQASLEIIKVQLGKTILSSPISGVVAHRNAEVGEIAQPGASILTITELEEVTLTAYVPESKIGLVRLGQEALVSVDSYPAEGFRGKVVYISPRALFTPKNIQMKEEREKTVFPVKIRLTNLERKLKPGMPADAQILVPSSIP